ncbi:type IV toxin-antitoxin system AbiEi family antitoxin [Gaoshiqia sediminis]|uniref:Type IV toxin-antitoxin system AbiEi family antitoxin n=1 Tax=Gaoshiqia sediminis TaxID=2986998 RepID=A0AA41Y772_9BACT|nr:type IV toxin-antitoxin system AbiEi family antitoxin [Gaoshiqia sediminis]MCW0482377.1 type IV toxin-antitoxin system AbiEi family antitoxin [Gaoshiqia sediminis]
MKKEIINIALENLQKTTGIEGFWQDKDELDGCLNLKTATRKFTLVVQFKNEIRQHQLHQIIRLNNQYENFILVANRIFPNLKEELRMQEIPYLEANGNLFLKKGDTFLFIDTNEPISVGKEKGNRAFTKTGLKVLFHLLQNKDDINLPQRELANLTNVGLGNIPQVIEGLKETGYLLRLDDKTYAWENRRELLDRWVTEYKTVLKPKLKKERFGIAGNWKDIIFDNGLTVWGGEPAADLLTNYLRPEKYIIYTKENRIELMKNYRLMPKPEGEIEILEMFWEQPKHQQTAPPILVYAELVLEGGKRNKETAEIIFNEYIQPNL